MFASFTSVKERASFYTQLILVHASSDLDLLNQTSSKIYSELEIHSEQTVDEEEVKNNSCLASDMQLKLELKKPLVQSRCVFGCLSLFQSP